MTLPISASTGPASTNLASTVVSASADTGWIAAVSPCGELRLPNPPDDADTIAMNRRTRTGTTYRIDLDGGISCWLDGDQQDGDGALNWIATQMCGVLSGGAFDGPDDAPFVCGLVLFTGTAAGNGLHGPRGLSEAQLRHVVNAYATASTDEPCDVAPIDGARIDAAADILAGVTRPPLAVA
jgi:hypothetical protein